MTAKKKSSKELLKENENLRLKLNEAEETLNAIRNGEVDAIVVSSKKGEGEKVFTFKGADHIYRILLENMNEGAATLAFDGTVMYCNRRLSEMFKVPISKIIGSSIQSYIHPQDISKYNSIIAQGVRGESSGEVMFNRKDKTVLSVLVSCAPIKTDKTGVCVIFTDLTQHKVEEEQIHIRNQAIESASDGIFIVDARKPAFPIIYANQVFQKMTGFAKNDIIGKSYLFFHKTESSSRFVKDIRHTIEQGKTYHSEIQTYNKGGKELWILLRIAPVRDINRSITNYIGVQTDITLAKQEELMIRTQREELLHVTRVGKLAEFVSSLAHEISQPLTSILSYAQAGQRMLSDREPELKKILSYIVDDDRRASEVIQRLRSLLKKSKPEKKPLDINILINETVVLIETDVIVRNVLVKLDLDSHIPLIKGDRIQLQQVLLNLLSNSFDAMQDNQALSEIAIRTSFKDTNTILVAVKDSGCGISEKNMPKLFTHFFTSKPDGLGMGLSISRSIIENHGGKLYAENNSGRGVTFYFTIPIK